MRRGRCRLETGLVVVALVLIQAVVAPHPADAARTSFNPAIRLLALYSENVDLVGNTGESDTSLRLAIDLPLVRETQRTSWTLAYTPHIEQFDRRTDLDNVAHRFGLRARHQVDRRSSLGFDASYSLSEDQGQFEDPAFSDLVLVNRVERRYLESRLEYEQRGRSLDWSVGGTFTDSSFDEIAEVGAPVADLEDRTRVAAFVEGLRRGSRGVGVGFSVEIQQTDLERSGDETAYLLGALIGGSIEDRYRWRLRVGAFRRSGDTVDATGATSEEGVHFNFEATREARRHRLRLRASHAPASGGALSGTSTDTRLGLSTSVPFADDWSWQLGIAGKRRDPTDPTRMTVESFTLGTGLAWDLQRLLSLEARIDHVEQNSADPTRKASYARGSFGLVLYPLGRARISGNDADAD